MSNTSTVSVQRLLGGVAVVACLLAGPVTTVSAQTNGQGSAGQNSASQGTGPAANQAHPAPASFADLAKAKQPAVVTITATSAPPARQQTANEAPGQSPFPFPPGTPFRDFLEDLLRRQMPGGGQSPQSPQSPMQPMPERPTSALGSGFVIDPSGYIVTNNHVVQKADKVQVTLQDRRQLDAKIIGTDPQTDLALLKASSDKPLPTVQWGDSEALQVGDWVLAIGNPFGLGGTVTAGILSARGRDIGAGPYDDFLQTDAAINSGNSGGPMFDMAGNVIGVNTAIFSRSGGNIGIGFAIPSALAKPIIAELRDKGRVTRGYLGVSIQPLTPDIAQALGLPDRSGALVAEVVPDSPASKAGIESGDVVTKFGGETIEDAHELSRAAAMTAPGSTVPVTVWRNGKSIPLEARVAELQPPAQQAEAEQVKPAEGQLGMTLAPMTPELRQQFDLPQTSQGAVVVQVAPDSPAARNGFQPGDVIARAGQQPVDEPSDVADAVKQARDAKKDSVLLLRKRGEGSLFVPLPLG
ncbi:DegQ family serine endoprotease [Azospirillum sp. SYSU D00513]|uniref:DegQ family serine endoprotease n=1 Tax=Azospirillum sp. SYSU D00513 TaxID=2812561 RepID=UPI001A96486B|nr:DegQ family serine endoprotease [Azospirillum sp. SYSU D00513]